jgi:hypothetical protein
MRSIERLAVITGLLLGLVAVTAAPAAEKVKVDVSSPKASATTFLKALGAGDVDAAKAASAGSPEHVKYLEAITSMFSGISRYEQAAAKAFPQDPNITTMAKGMTAAIAGPEMLARIDKGKVNVTGETATILPAEDEAKPGDPPAPAKDAAAREKETIRLRNVDGQWKIDLDSQFESEEMRQQNPEDMIRFGQSIDALAADIEGGKYKSSIEAQAAFMKVIMEAHATAQANKAKDAATAAGAKQEGDPKVEPNAEKSPEQQQQQQQQQPK